MSLCGRGAHTPPPHRLRARAGGVFLEVALMVMVIYVPFLNFIFFTNGLA